MAGSRPSSVSSLTSSQNFTSRLLFLLTLLPLTLAAFAFILQWRGGLTDPLSRWSPDHHEFPGMETASSSASLSRIKDSGCRDPLGRSHDPSFPYYRNWKFDFGSDLKPKVSFDSFFFSSCWFVDGYFVSSPGYKIRLCLLIVFWVWIWIQHLYLRNAYSGGTLFDGYRWICSFFPPFLSLWMLLFWCLSYHIETG